MGWGAATAAIGSAAAGTLDPQGPAAEAIADLWWLMLVLGVAVFVLFTALLIAGLARRRTPDRGSEPDEHRHLVGRWIVIGGVVMPVVVIVVVFVATLQAMRAVPPDAPHDALDVEIIGHQFWYEVRYPERGIVTANELHLPVGRPIAVRLTSADVIHSFWVPALGGKLDMMPERTNTLVLQADEPGEHRSKCAEFCGLQHARMGLIVVAEPEEQFADWLLSQEEAPEPTGEEALRGQEVFVGAGCASCHAAPATPAGDGDGPDLVHVASRRTLGAALLDNTWENAAAWIADPQAIKSGVNMPASELTDAELESLLIYLGYQR